jgi:hypothetical protein
MVGTAQERLCPPYDFFAFAGDIACCHASQISASSSFFETFAICTITFAILPHMKRTNTSGAASNRELLSLFGQMQE